MGALSWNTTRLAQSRSASCGTRAQRTREAAGAGRSEGLGVGEKNDMSREPAEQRVGRERSRAGPAEQSLGGSVERNRQEVLLNMRAPPAARQRQQAPSPHLRGVAPHAVGRGQLPAVAPDDQRLLARPGRLLQPLDAPAWQEGGRRRAAWVRCQPPSSTAVQRQPAAKCTNASPHGAQAAAGQTPPHPHPPARSGAPVACSMERTVLPPRPMIRAVSTKSSTRR